MKKIPIILTLSIIVLALGLLQSPTLTGDWIFFHCFSYPNTRTDYVVRPDGSEIIEITRLDDVNYRQFLISDGQNLLYVQHGNLYIRSISNHLSHRLFSEIAYIGDFAYASESDQVFLYMSNGDRLFNQLQGNWGVYIFSNYKDFQLQGSFSHSDSTDLNGFVVSNSGAIWVGIYKTRLDIRNLNTDTEKTIELNLLDWQYPEYVNISHNGKFVTYLTRTPEKPFEEEYNGFIVDLDKELIIKSVDIAPLSGIIWSSNDEKIAYAEHDYSNSLEPYSIIISDRNGVDPHRIINLPCRPYLSSWVDLS